MSAPAPSKRKARKNTKAQTAKPKPVASKPKAAAKAVSKTVELKQPVEVNLNTEKELAETTAAQVPPTVVTDEQIGQRAYQIWLEKGRPYGQEQANWGQAVAELRG